MRGIAAGAGAFSVQSGDVLRPDLLDARGAALRPGVLRHVPQRQHELDRVGEKKQPSLSESADHVALHKTKR